MGTASNRLTVSVRIAGHDYKVRGEGDEEGLVRIAGYVDRAMERVRERTGTVDSLDVAVLTCLNLAREILALHDQRASAVDDGRVRSLIERVEAVLDDRSAGERGSVSEPETRLSSESAADALELTSVEALRDRRSTSGESIEGMASDPASPRARAAAGGRDRIG
ncbi:MAG TPA: cell division protein ZapA [Planctomycetota bacterium]|nr:cell division protein ZapA [Planctomycetota bacterium]